MKRIIGLLIMLSAVNFAHAQSTMPAMGANTLKGEVAQTDASLNQVDAAKRNNTNMKSVNGSNMQTRKSKITKSKSTTKGAM